MCTLYHETQQEGLSSSLNQQNLIHYNGGSVCRVKWGGGSGGR